ncbi:hypothetical protein ASC59_09745 [Leifsonia sp. Root1293]|nr:hypothetical protein ASC59_09745 [Leifsonia sp. Root1293]KRA12813.1 hypothetical protein ASD61_09745 [Leifsonia sp. Root60]
MPPVRDDRILPFTWWLSLAIIPFLVVASVLLYLLPGSTDQTFAWTIQPDITAMFLGCAYLGGIWFFLQVFRVGKWHRISHGLPAVFVFATLLSIATFLHWDRFHFGHISFITWVTLYVTTPVLVLAAGLLNRRTDPRTPDRLDAVIPGAVRALLVVVGVSAFVTGAVLFAFPNLLLGAWAWEVTPLTARVVGAVLTLPGTVNIWMLRDARWSAFRWVFQAQIVSLVFIVLALVLRWDDLVWEHPAAWAFTIGIGFSLVAYVAFFLLMDRRRFTAPAT